MTKKEIKITALMTAIAALENSLSAGVVYEYMDRDNAATEKECTQMASEIQKIIHGLDKRIVRLK